MQTFVIDFLVVFILIHFGRFSANVGSTVQSVCGIGEGNEKVLQIENSVDAFANEQKYLE